MKTKTFIQEVAHGHQTKEKSVASVWFDGKHLYSYGRHYPLLININGKWILNDHGYSNTTAKHISHARGYNNYVIDLNGSTSLEVKDLYEVVTKDIESKYDELLKLSSRAWKQEETLKARIEELVKTQDFLYRTLNNINQ